MRRRASKSVRATGVVQLGMAAAVRFVGRSQELAAASNALTAAGPSTVSGADRTVLVMRGPAGAGKSRLARHLAAQPALTGHRTATVVACEPGERAVAVVARAERLMGVLPGDATQALRTEPRLLVIDDLHVLSESEARHLLAELTGGLDRAHGPGRVLVISRDTPPLRRDVRPFVLDLGGLAPADARELWDQLEATHGPTRQRACDSALARTRGMPLALCRAYAEAALGPDAWHLASLAAGPRRILELLAVLGRPTGPAAMTALAPGVTLESALSELVARQLVEPLEDGRVQVHPVLRDMVLEAMYAPRRCTWAHEIATWLAAGHAGPGGCDSALDLADPADRTRIEIGYWLEAGDWARAVGCLIAGGPSVLARGGDGEVAGLVALLEERMPRDPGADDDPAAQDAASALASMRLAISLRRGEVTRALALDTGHDPVTSAVLRYRAGRLSAARRRLQAAASAPDPDLRCRAAVHLAGLALAAGDPGSATQAALGAFERDHALASSDTRALLHLTLAALDGHAGRLDAARAALARAAGIEGIDPELSARIEARHAVCLAQQGRLRGAEDLLERAARTARAAGATSAADEIHLCRSRVALLRGDLGRAATELRTLVRSHRRRGDEVGALTAEVELAWALARQGEMAAAAELASACRSAAERAGLHGLRARAGLVEAAIDTAELRHDTARPAIEALLADPGADAETRAEAARLLARARAASGDSAAALAALAAPVAGELRDDIAADATRARVILAGGDAAQALALARDVAVRAERAGRRAELASILALVARLAMCRGDRAGAEAAAVRAEREARDTGLRHSHALARLVLAGLARGQGRLEDAVELARSAAIEAATAGHGLAHLVAREALCALEDDAGAGSDTPDDDGADFAGADQARAAAAATLPPAAAEAAARMAADLGLSAACPYRTVAASGAETRVADASPERLRLDERSLAVDRVREVVLRNGTQIASLRRRSLLKRLLYLFAGAPGRTFSKETIVERVWEVDYHPLRHDAALFTNIMRMRRLLGEDGAEILQVSDDGYRFVPPGDFVYVEPAAGPDAA